MICELTGMEVANASTYDLSTACAEAVLMARRIRGGQVVAISEGLHPEYKEVLQTYLRPIGVSMVEVKLNASMQMDPESLKDVLNQKPMAVLVQTPNFFGAIEDSTQWLSLLPQEEKPLLIIACAQPHSLAYLKTPGEMGADIAILEGQALGVGLNLGGPYLGILATRKEYIRQMPGRIVGKTVDTDGNPGYVLTFSTREQHIRREKATSNICTNQGLCALMATIYMALMGPRGMEIIADLCFSRAESLKNKLSQIKGIRIVTSAPTFNEFVIEVDALEAKLPALYAANIEPGLPLKSFDAKRANQLLVCVTEMNTPEDLEACVNAWKQASAL
jgi:glycine dehydrogenase subunit 1